MDGCFLKGICKCQFLVVVGKDATNHMYLIAWAVYISEDKVTWRWFLQWLVLLLDLKDGSGLTVTSNMQKVDA